MRGVEPEMAARVSASCRDGGKLRPEQLSPKRPWSGFIGQHLINLVAEPSIISEASQQLIRDTRPDRMSREQSPSSPDRLYFGKIWMINIR